MLARSTRLCSLLTLSVMSIIAAAAAPALARQKVMDEAAKQRPAPSDRWLIVHCGTLLDMPGKPPRKNCTVIIKNDRISSVFDGFVEAAAIKDGPAPGDANIRTIDLKEHYVLPGLIDCHVHLTFETSPDQRLRFVEDSDADAALNGLVYAQRTLNAGFTTVRDVGANGDAIFALRDAINDGMFPGPRIIAAGRSVTPTGGHADRTHGYREDLFAIPTTMQGVADGADQCRQAVRAQVKRGSDCIKITATGGVLSNTAAGMEQQFFEDELKAIVETAHQLNRKVAAHAHGTRGVNAALRAGVDSIEHGTFIDDESIKLFKQTGAFYVPTITAGKTVGELAEVTGYYTPAVVEKARKVGPKIQDTFGKAYKEGVKIAFGTDAGVFPHGINAIEFVFMTQAGMPAAEAIKSATVTAADLLGLSAEVGTIEPGKSADLIAVAGDPTRDITELQRVRWVVKSGRVCKEP